MQERQAVLHSIETCGAVDGPGLRFIAFFQGCLMRCLYCHNRDSWPLTTDKSEVTTVSKLMQEIKTYQHYLRASGGGVTASGGEPLLQHAFIADWFTACQEMNLHTCLDTNGFARQYDHDLIRLLDHTDLVMLDLKQINPEKHKVLVGVPNDKTLNFARYLQERGQKVRVRYVVVPQYSDDEDSAHLLGKFIEPMENVLEVELLPYHELGSHKWALFGDTNKLAGIHPPKPETMKKIKEILESYGKPVFF
ncbi:pyruvate formate-lyase-activating protein [Dichelobacter nodosus]|uniref:Pyruvate formate-lyase-activating enzyme n=1 Tax=Dichelobacter nodosus (strain VCS1703A) TaxID=246195 RepID=A5EX30_DICNV|nr:pyruvate formate-lyase-activating protein [Dichelobacter nodosus]ABQ14046.1 pyruvate formate-lyase activating enzyme [Dichelobacter nodosus VCS1703A]AXM46079.1 pyruvate formate lyase-activating protein [Dichelobacter nodosus]TGA66459.1 pyruvate formate lyase-activating protein [Dichelobacter nodosus]